MPGNEKLKFWKLAVQNYFRNEIRKHMAEPLDKCMSTIMIVKYILKMVVLF